MALFSEDYSISDPRTGDAQVRKLAVTGWSNVLLTKTEHGRLYWKVTTSGASSTLKFYLDEAKASGDEVMTGTFTVNADAFVAVTLSASNSSGLTGTAVVKGLDSATSTGDVIISYAEETDLARELKDLTSLLTSAQWEGGTRFESALKQTKRDLDMRLTSMLRTRFKKKTTNEIQLADIARPRDLAQVHALYCCALLMYNRAGNDPQKIDIANNYTTRANDLLKSVALAIDFDNDDVVDSTPALGSSVLIRG